MKTKQQHKEFDTVTFFRHVKEQMSKELQGMTFEEQKKYFAKTLTGKSKLKTSK